MCRGCIHAFRGLGWRQGTHKLMRAHQNVVAQLNKVVMWYSGKEPALPMWEIRETRVQSLGWEDPLEKEMATHSGILAGKISSTQKPRYSQWDCKELDLTERLSTHTALRSLQVQWREQQHGCQGYTRNAEFHLP